MSENLASKICIINSILGKRRKKKYHRPVKTTTKIVNHTTPLYYRYQQYADFIYQHY